MGYVAKLTDTTESKPGIFTSEFLTMVGLDAMTWIGHATQSGQLPLKWTVAINAVLGVAYKVSRGIAKAGQAYYGGSPPPSVLDESELAPGDLS